MRFLDDNIKLKINGLIFKAYLEDSDITHETKDQKLPFVPLSFRNDSMATRVTEKAKFRFNVFSETRAECIHNYNQLLNLIYSIKPNYNIVDDQLVPDTTNVTGLVDLFFSGMPSRDNIKMHLTNFNYSINKDIGYIQVPRSEIKDYTNASFYEPGNMKLIPLAYVLSLEGNVLLDFKQTAHVRGAREDRQGGSIGNAIKAVAGNNPQYQNDLTTMYKNLNNGKDILSLKTDTEVKQALSIVKQIKDSYLAGVDGKLQDKIRTFDTPTGTYREVPTNQEHVKTYSDLVDKLQKVGS